MLELSKKGKETKPHKSTSTQVISFRGTLGDSVMICNCHDSFKKNNGIILLMSVKRQRCKSSIEKKPSVL